MRKIFVLLGLLVSFSACCQTDDSTKLSEHYLKSIWVTEKKFETPESVLLDTGSNVLYVSMMDGASAERDGKGGIALLGTDGKIIDMNWVTGLNAPKGMARYENRLYTADLTELVVIDILKKQIIKKITIDSAIVLNDVTVDDNGTVYVSDHKAGMVFKVREDKATIFLKKLTKPNGLTMAGKNLLVLTNNALYRTNTEGSMTLMVDSMGENLDGIATVMESEYLISYWTGMVYYIKKDGTKQLLLDTRQAEKFSADIDFDMHTKILYIPMLYNKTVAAYSLK